MSDRFEFRRDANDDPGVYDANENRFANYEAGETQVAQEAANELNDGDVEIRDFNWIGFMDSQKKSN